MWDSQFRVARAFQRVPAEPILDAHDSRYDQPGCDSAGRCARDALAQARPRRRTAGRRRGLDHSRMGARARPLGVVASHGYRLAERNVGFIELIWRRSRHLPLLACALFVLVAGCGGASQPTADPGGHGPRLVGDAPPRHAVLWAVGDGDASDEAQAVVDRIVSDHPDRVLYLGDVYDEGTAADFKRNYAPSYGRLAADTAPTPGNHDWPNHEQGYDPYWARAHGVASTPPWFAFRAAGWRVVSLNSQERYEPGSPQYRFARAALSGPGDCRVAFWHRPRFSAGTVHGDQQDLEPLWDLLGGHARIAIAGHDHNLQRLRPVEGVTQFVSGAGGHDRYGINSGDERLQFGNADSYGALRLALRPGRADFSFVNTKGAVLDRGTIRCRTG